MANLLSAQAMLPAKVVDCSGGRWSSGFARAVIFTISVSISSTAWADAEGFDLSGFDGISATEGQCQRKLT